MKTHLGTVLGLAEAGEMQLAEALADVAQRHAADAGIRDVARQLASWSHGLVQRLPPLLDRYGAAADSEPRRLRRALFHGARQGGLGLLQDLADLRLLAWANRDHWLALIMAAAALQDSELEQAVTLGRDQSERQLAWLETQLKASAAQALLVDPALPKGPLPQT